MRINKPWLALLAIAPLTWAAPPISTEAGEAIAYLRLTEGYWQVWVTDSQGQHHRQVTTDAMDKTRVSWYPDRKHLLANRSDGTLAQIDVNSGGQTTLDLPVQGMFDAQLGPKGEWIIFSVTSTNRLNNNNLWKVRIEGAQLTKLTHQVGLQLAPSWDGDGASVVYTAVKINEDHQVWTHNLQTGSQSQITVTRGADNFDPAYSPQGDIAYSANNSGDYNLWIVDSGSQTARQLTDDEGFEGEPTWSPSGQSLAYVALHNNTRQLRVTDRNGTRTTVISAGGKVRSPAWWR